LISEFNNLQNIFLSIFIYTNLAESVQKTGGKSFSTSPKGYWILTGKNSEIFVLFERFADFWDENLSSVI